MRELSLHIMDMVENSVAADASCIAISIEESHIKDKLSININDNGVGMDQLSLEKVVNPFYTTKEKRRVGLGIPLVKAAAEECNGCFNILSTPGKGTEINIDFQCSHIDLMPMGDLSGTLLTLIVGHPQIHWLIKYQVDGAEFYFDDQLLKDTLGDVPLTDPGVITFLREYLDSGVSILQETEV